MNTAKKICESDEQGVVHVDVPIGRPGHRVEVLVVWGEVAPGNEPQKDAERPLQDENARRARLQRYTTWTEEDLQEFQSGLAAQRVVDSKLWA
jgi:hypothetical protein